MVFSVVCSLLLSKGVGTKGTPLCSLQSTLLSVVFSVVCSLLSSGNCSATYTKQGREKENREPTSRLKKRIIRNECEIDDDGGSVRVNRVVATVTGLGSGVEKGTQKAITPTFSWVQMASIPYANSGGGEGGHNEQRPSSSDRRKPPSLL